MADNPHITHQVLKQIAQHVVFPRCLSHNESTHLQLEELQLTAMLYTTIVANKNKFSWPPSTIKLLESFMKISPLDDANDVSTEIKNIDAGEMLGMYVRQQNCALILYRPSANDEDYIVATFPTKLDAYQIHQCNSDLQFNYPTQSLKVKMSSLLRSKDFAAQICYCNSMKFESDEPNPTPNPYVSKWLVTALADRSSLMTNNDEFPSITKKVRDEVLGTFRRSGCWMALKVFLQLNLTIEYGEKIGRFVYKVILLEFHTNLCNSFGNKGYEVLDIDLIGQMLSKTARRIEKLMEDADTVKSSETFDAFIPLYVSVICNAKTAISKLRTKLDHQIEILELSDTRKAQLAPLKQLNFDADVYQKVPNLEKYLEMRKVKCEQDGYDGSVHYKRYSRHQLNKKQQPEKNLFPKLANEIEINLFMTDYEYWFLHELTLDDGSKWDPTELREHYFCYTSKAESFYKNDPLGSSKMFLLRLKFVAILDKIATHHHPLLKRHRVGIKPSIFDGLLLPVNIDMAIAFELQTYFNQRNETATAPALIEEEHVTTESFAVQYAAANADMQDVRQRIQQMAEGKIEEKRAEWLTERRRVQEMRERANKMSCEYGLDYYGYRIHERWCSLCALNDQIGHVKISLYERPLPTDVYRQNAVVFELRIGIEIACLRDVLGEIASSISRATEKVNNRDNWYDYIPISAYKTSNCQRVTLCSTSPLMLSRRYQPKTYHVDDPFERFIVLNGYNFTYQHQDRHLPSEISAQSVNKFCTLHVRNGSAYENLQWTVNTTEHTQNEVIAMQSDCPVTLSLAEYKNFGSLRADGHRMQLRKLYAMIETEALSFEEPSVLALVLQTIWTTGPIGDCAFRRESHEDYTDPIFANEMIELLNKFIEQQKCNWKHPLKCMTVALITVRIFELSLNERLVNRIVRLLRKLREITVDWMGKIQAAIHEANGSTANEMLLRDKLIEVAIAGACTFFVHRKHKYFPKIFDENGPSGHAAQRMWLEFIITINNNILLSDASTSTDRRMFLRLVRNIGLHIEVNLAQTIVNNPAIAYDFIENQWSQARDGNFTRSYFAENQSQVLIAESDENRIVIDIITGDFNVNNQPVAKLSENITQSQVFQRVFNQFIFEVQPSQPNRFSTIQRYNGCDYDFYLNPRGEVIITERRANGSRYELVPDTVLKNDVTYLLVERYSHWWNVSENVIEFRPKSFTDERFMLPDGVEYKLDLNAHRLVHMKTGNEMLDVNSDGCKNITKQLSRLECKHYIHIFMERPKVARIDLMRMRLRFEVDTTDPDASEYNLISNEFAGMCVSLQQKQGTLFGLNNGLYLESIGTEKKTGRSKLLILPHGKVIASATDSYHSTVSIVVDDALSTPPFHVYRIDEFCQQLVSRASNYTAWFYLAYMHALTSHGAAEPFTGLTGTERALQILQSAFVWSSAPYDEEAFRMLEAISKLSPGRKFDAKKGIKTVYWPNHIPSHAAQDSFALITSKLLADSQRLYGLYFRTDEQKFAVKTELMLNRKDYLRWLEFGPNLRITSTIVDNHELRTTQSTFDEAWTSLKNTRTVSMLYHDDGYHISSSFDLRTFLFGVGSQSLDGMAHSGCTENILSHSNKIDFVNLWISLYDNVRRNVFSKEQLALMFSLLAHNGNSIDAILALQTVARNSSSFASIIPPNVARYNLNDLNYDSAVIENILKRHHSYPYYFDSRTPPSIQNLTDAITRMWPCYQVHESIHRYAAPDIKIHSAIEEINGRLLNWNNNRKLLEFIQEVSSELRSVQQRNGNINLSDWMYIPRTTSTWTKFRIDYESKLSKELPNYEADVILATEIYNKRKIGNDARSAQQWWDLLMHITQSTNAKHLIDANLYPRMVKCLMLPRLLSSTTNGQLKSIIGTFATKLAREQHSYRISTFEQQPEAIVALQREQENEPHANWYPCEYPEWLLFEIEQNLSVRRIQIEIANRMINPPQNRAGTQHSVMQLNMGEGKTHVITPILATVLSDGNRVCQITVLKSLYATNLKSLRQSLGGMLNRRVYTFPCRRDMPIEKCVTEIIQIYDECKQHRGVILTLPEYRLSFQLKIYEMVCKGQSAVANQFLTAHKWINSNVRSILDESDAILQAKYQLIYTIGKREIVHCMGPSGRDQLPLDGGAARWVVIQALLKRIPIQMRKLYDKYGNDKIEFDVTYLQNKNIFGGDVTEFRSDVFMPCRILDATIYDELKVALVDDFIDGRINVIFSEIVTTAEMRIRRLLCDKNINKETFDAGLNEFPIEQQHVILILGGLLRFEVLRLVLTKRWRINYGVNKNGKRKMAIPFKAKDVAAEMTEFGHPDVALCFTQLSYYYSGLSNEQLVQVFKILEIKQNPSEIYEQWIASISKELIDPSVQSYTGINLADPKQREEIIFPLFRYNMHVIDYFLSNAVYPREAKTFEKKLMCTAWDLCSEHMNHTVSGFSGTNDTKNILPLTIAQNDLPVLEQTNEEVRNILLRDENQAYKSLPPNVSGKAILEILTEQQIPVLLDCGALMLELNNEEVAKNWLKLVPSVSFDAAIFFNEKDILMTIDRNDIKSEFDSSVHRDKMHRCLVYLDDVHTRGTDLKFPPGWRACVTLCGDITRDKTVQACMRMRLLGNGHSIAFWASYEADMRIRWLCELGAKETPTNEDAIKFICKNSENSEAENTVHWAAGAFNYTKKLAAHKQTERSGVEDAVTQLTQACYDDEFVSLHEMYGGKDDILLSNLFRHKFDRLAEGRSRSDVIQFIHKISMGVNQKINAHVPDLKRYTGLLDEEQEREVEHELEEERQIERPPAAEPCTPYVDPYLKQLVQHGAMHSSYHELLTNKTILAMPEAFENTKIVKLMENAAWPEHIYVTKDFVHVIAGNEYARDIYLRPVWWISCIRNTSGADLILLLSSFECNALLPDFRQSKNATLTMYRPRISQFHSNLLHNQQLCVTGAAKVIEIGLNDEVQINVFAGAQYFANADEQDAYCGFLGLIPRPRNSQNLELAFENGLIKPNGFVPIEHRQRSNDIRQSVGWCKFQQNPVALVIQIIEAHHEFLRTESHAASILRKGIKRKFTDE